MSRGALVAVALGFSLLAGCGGAEDLSVAAEGTLTRDVEAIAAAARADDATRVQELVMELRRHVEDYQAGGEVSSDRAAEILAAAARVATDVGPPEPEPEVVVSVVPAPPAAPEKGGDVGEGEGAEKDDGKGSDDKGKSDGKDDEKDEDEGKGD